ncbi:MAG: hypothetical protein EON48_17395 [Acetobacteraceae bacterium]|nr:MAG: hypothetical protein EON48_17395 [Acetobacteraceae bacterium]
MTELFGDKATFAIEYELAQEQEAEPFSDLGPLLNLSYWIGGHRISNPDLPTYAGYLTERLIHHLRDGGHRRNDELMALPAVEAAGILGSRHDDRFSQRAMDERWAAHEIGQPLDSAEYLDGLRTDWEVYVVEGEQTGRIIARRAESPETVLISDVAAGDVDRVLRATWESLEHLIQPA